MADAKKLFFELFDLNVYLRHTETQNFQEVKVMKGEEEVSVTQPNICWGVFIEFGSLFLKAPSFLNMPRNYRVIGT